MDKIIAIFCSVTIAAIMLLTFPDGIVAMFMTAIIALPVAFLIRQNTDDSKYLIQIFLVALTLRLIFGAFLHIFDLRDFFGGDAVAYDAFGARLLDSWYGTIEANDYFVKRMTNTDTPGWGMYYLVAIIYGITGRNILAAQSFCAVVGAATAPMVYFCAQKIFNNRRAARMAALLVAVFPSFIIWSGQLLKDGLIIFLLVLAMTMVMQLREKFNYFAVIFLLFAIFGILSLRFYIFYMLIVSVVGSFVLGQSVSAKTVARGFILMVVMGLALTYLGVLNTASENYEKWGSLERVQNSRAGLATSAESGYGVDADVSTAGGALTVIPVGFTYLMLAPFPWQLGSLRQSVTIPEMIIWWCSMPLLIIGLVYTIKHKLRNAVAVLIFTLMLTISYSVFQGNVGTAYRQRTQIQVFLFIFIAVGWTLRKEKKENERFLKAEKKRKLDNYLRESRALDSI